MQVVLSYIVVSNELRKFTDEPTQKIDQSLVASISSLSAVILAVIFAFFYIPVCLLFVSISFYFVVFLILEFVYSKNKLGILMGAVAIFFTLILFAVLNKFFSGGVEFVLLTIAPGIISCFSILQSFLKKSAQ